MEQSLYEYISGYFAGLKPLVSNYPNLFFELTDVSFALVTTTIGGRFKFLGPYDFFVPWNLEANPKINFNNSTCALSAEDAQEFVQNHRFIEYAGVLLPGDTEWEAISRNIGSDLACYTIDNTLELIDPLLKNVPWALIILPDEPHSTALLIGRGDYADLIRTCGQELATSVASFSYSLHNE